MENRKILLAILLLLLYAAGPALCGAEPDTRAKAQVFTRETTEGARLTFSWDSRERVPFTVSHDENRVILHFEEPVALRWGSALKAVHPYIEQVETKDGGNTVILSMSEPSTAHYLENAGPRVVDNDKNGIDLIAQTDSEPGMVAASEDSESEPDHIHSPKPAWKAAIKSHHKQAKKIKMRLAKITAAQHAPKKPEEAMKPASPAPEPAESKVSTSLEAEAMAKLAPSAGEAKPASSSTETAENAASPVSGPVQTSAPVEPVTVSIEPSSVAPLAVSIPLPFKSTDAFAVFVWQKQLWIVSDGTKPQLAEDLKKTAVASVQDIRSVPDPTTTILYLPLKEELSASVEKTPSDGLNIVLGPGKGKLVQRIEPVLTTTLSGKASVTIPAGKGMHAFTFSNPLTGDRLNVVPLADPGAGVGTTRKFVEFNILQSAQGIAVQTLSDTASVTLDKEKLMIAAPQGLALSPETMSQMMESESDAALSRIPPTLFPYARWRVEDEKNFVPTQIKLLDEIVSSSPAYANKARLRLLGLYLAEGLLPEALGMSNDILRSSLKFYQDNRVSAMRGAAYLFMYRISEAARDFSAPELKNDPESQMLYRLCEELLGNDKEVFDFSGNYDRYISHYPPSFIQNLAIIAADRAINRKNYAAANAIFETLKHDNYDDPVKKYVDYMHAKILSETHEEAEATKIWEYQSKDLDDPLIRARAEFSLINMLLKSSKITHEEAAAKLEQLRIVWRGDSLELGILTLLGNLYVQDKKFDKALHTMRDVVLYYPEAPEAVTTAKEMETIFVTLYNKGAGDSMPPLEALSLFYEFRDLVPLGKDGDQMIRNLAERLVNLDLLDRAALLLDHQIRNRLTGEERSRIAAQLAHIYLLNHQPDEAIGTLKTTGYGDLPADLQLERLRLTAQALAQQKKANKAIDVISSDNTPEGTLLRLSIYWDSKDWANVVSTAEDILGNRADPSSPLNVPESEVLLKLATAYVYEHDTGQLQYLRDYFTPLMKNNPNRDNFRFITSESGAVDYDNLATLDQDIGAVKSYLDKSQDKPGKSGLSKATN